MVLDPAAARGLRVSGRWIGVLASSGAVIVGGFIGAAVIDPNAVAPAVNADQSPGLSAFVTLALVVGVVLLLAALIGFVRRQRQRRTLARSSFVQVPARWAPTRVRGQSVSGVAVEQSDGSWLALTIPTALRTRKFETEVRAAGAVDIARVGGYAVVRAPGTTALLSAKPKAVAIEPPPDSSAPLVTLRAGARVATEPDANDGAVWFRDAMQLPRGAAIRVLVLLAYVTYAIVRQVLDGELASVGSVLVTVFLIVSGIAVPVMWFVLKTVTTVDRAGITRRRIFRPPHVISFDRIATVARYPTGKASFPTKVVMTLDDASTVAIQTRQPDAFLAALQRGRAFS